MSTYWYCGVKIKRISTVYSYISHIGEIPVGSYVEVPFGKENTPLIGYVVRSGEYTWENAPYPVEKTKRIIRIATWQEYIRQNAGSEDCDFDDELDELDYYIETGDWDEVLGWACERNDSPHEYIIRKVIECYELCIRKRMPVAALNLGTFYYDGKYVRQDFQKAFELYEMAADDGNLRAICNCGCFFYYGRHQEIDYAEALRYFSLGALLFDDANCLYKLGDMYLCGYGTDRNEKYAYLLYERALDRCYGGDGDDACTAEAQLRVGRCLLHGIGVEMDVEKAHTLLSYALIKFYKRRKTDNSVFGSIERTRDLIAEAQERLGHETFNF